MVIGETLKSMRFVTDQKGRRTAIVLDIELWERLVEWIETITDAKIAAQALAELEQTGGRPAQAGWLAGDDISEDWSDQEKTTSETIAI
jgi:hypothetical protein